MRKWNGQEGTTLGWLVATFLIALGPSPITSHMKDCMPQYRRLTDTESSAPVSAAPLRLSDFVHVILVHKARHDYALEAHRPWRRLGIPAVLVTNVSDEEVAALNANSTQTLEYWVRVADSTPEERFVRPYIRRAALAPFIVNDTPLKDKYKYVFMGDDDTAVNFFALRHVLQHWDHNIPYVVTDGLMHDPTTLRPKDASWTYSSYLSPRCLPCHLDRSPLTANLIAMPGRGGFTPMLGCPCTLEAACSRRPQPDIRWLGNSTADCVAGVRDRHIPCIYGGSGMLFSRGLLGCPPFNNLAAAHEALRSFLAVSPPTKHEGGDILISRLLAHNDIWITDPATYWWEPLNFLPMNGEAKPYRSFGGFPGTEGWQLFDRVLDGSCLKDYNGCLRHVLSEVSRHKPVDRQQPGEMRTWAEKAIAAWHVLMRGTTLSHVGSKRV